jgi:KaiC/GvpD/RAD55 family RecA-like ATPase
MFPDDSLERIPEKSIILIEEDSGCMKDFYAQKIAAETSLRGQLVVYLTSHLSEDIVSQMTRFGMTLSPSLTIIDQCHGTGPVMEHCTGDLCIIDPVSSIFMDMGMQEFRSFLAEIRKRSRKGGSFLLVSDMGVLPHQEEQLLRAMADGVIRFLAVHEGDKIKRYMNVLKMKGEIPMDKLIPFTVTEEGLLIDTRERLG